MSEVGYLRTMISGVPMLAAPAEIDIITAEQLRTVLLHSAAREHATMVVDVTRTRFCDLAGLTVLAQEYKRGVSGGGELRLVLAADGAVSHVMNLTCLGR